MCPPLAGDARSSGGRAPSEDEVDADEAERGDAGLRAKNFAKELCETGTLGGDLRVPRTVGDMRLHIDLHARTLAISTEIKAPEDKNAKGSITWLTRQPADALGAVVIDSYYPKDARYGIPATLGRSSRTRH